MTFNLHVNRVSTSVISIKRDFRPEQYIFLYFCFLYCRVFKKKTEFFLIWRHLLAMTWGYILKFEVTFTVTMWLFANNYFKK